MRTGVSVFDPIVLKGVIKIPQSIGALLPESSDGRLSEVLTSEAEPRNNRWMSGSISL